MKPNDSATKLRNECLGFIHIVFLFKVRTIMLLSTQLIQWDAVRWKNSRCFKPACGGKSSTFWKWHCLRKIALESKRLIRTWWTWCQITWKRIFYPIQQKSMVFNQECCWNNGLKSLHSFWATLYSCKGLEVNLINRPIVVMNFEMHKIQLTCGHALPV